MAKNDIFMYALLGAGFLVFYYKFGGKQMIDDLLGDLKGGGGGSDFSFSGGGASVDVKLPPSAEGISNKVQTMLQKMGVDMNVDNGSGQDISRTKQTNTGTGGKITQTQSHSQKSDVFYTIPRFGNL